MEVLSIVYQIQKALQNISVRSFGAKIFLALLGAYLTALSAKLIIPLPFTPVPITGQVFVILLTAYLLGPIYGGLSQLIYVIAGASGLPWYAGGLAGLNTVITGGYLIGFIIAAVIIGYLSEQNWFGKSQWRIMIAMLIGLIAIYFLGAMYLAILMAGDVSSAIKLGVLPFIIPDLLKIFLAANIAYRIKKH